MASVSDKMIQNAVYHGEQNNNNFDRHVTIQKELHNIFEELEGHGYKGIDESLKFT